MIFLSQLAVLLASRLHLREIFFLVLTAGKFSLSSSLFSDPFTVVDLRVSSPSVATSPHLQTLHRFILDVLWIGFECFTRGVVVLGGSGGDRDRPYDDRRRTGNPRSRRRYD